jgi:hypothetical protein
MNSQTATTHTHTISTAHWARSWPLERVMFMMAGSMTILSAVLAALVSPWFLLLTAFVGLNQLAFVRFGACPSSLMISKIFGFRSVCDTRSAQ